jgi:alpha-glucosidase
MKKSLIKFHYFLLICIAAGCANQEKIELYSPNGEIKISLLSNYRLGNGRAHAFKIITGKRQILLPSSIQINSSLLNVNEVYTIVRTEKDSVKESWINNFGARKEIPDNYNSVKIFMENRGKKINLIFRAYNEGVAFAYEVPQQIGKDSIIIKNENISFRFPGNHTAWSTSRAQGKYSRRTVSTIEKECERPLVIEIDNTLTVALAEAKYIDYARMKFYPDTTSVNSIISKLDGEVHKQLPFQSPWRVVMIGRSPGDLLEKNYLLLNLNDPSAIEDVTWIKPGKVLREVTLTTKGAKNAVDFLSAHEMQYIEFDAGWYGFEYNDSSDARVVNVDPKRSKGPLDLQEIIKYAHSKNIGVLLYVNRRALEKQIDEILPIYSKWGISGLKFGFVQVGTQPVTNWMHEAVKKAAQYKMIVDVHDEYRPTGFSRTYPNFLTQEGIRGDEESPANSHTLITMFTRTLAGAADNTVCYYDNRVDAKMGSHASQLAKAVCIFSPLQFLYWYDKPVPTDRKKELWGKPNFIGDEPELEFFDNIPTTWDETKVLYGKIGEYGVIARKKGDEWFIGGINGDQAITLDINFSFLEPGKKYTASIYSDDPEVKTRTHVKIERVDAESKTVYPAVLGSNKGIAMHIKPKNR